MKKAQMGESIGDKLAAKTAERKTKGRRIEESDISRLNRIAERNPDRSLRVAKRIVERVNTSKDKAKPMMKHGGKAENGAKKTAFGMLSVKKGIDNNPNPTFADKIAGAKKKAMSGMEVMKNGGKKAAKQAAIAIAMKKAGKAPKKKMQYGGEAASMVPKKKMMKNGGGILSAPKKDGLSIQLGYYQNTIGKNTKGKNTKAVGLTKAMYGKSVMKSGGKSKMGKCKSGC